MSKLGGFAPSREKNFFFLPENKILSPKDL